MLWPNIRPIDPIWEIKPSIDSQSVLDACLCVCQRRPVILVASMSWKLCVVSLNKACFIFLWIVSFRFYKETRYEECIYSFISFMKVYFLTTWRQPITSFLCFIALWKHTCWPTKYTYYPNYFILNQLVIILFSSTLTSPENRVVQ